MDQEDFTAPAIQLTELVSALRLEIQKAQDQLKKEQLEDNDAEVVFDITEVCIEVQTVVTREENDALNGKLKLGIVEFGANMGDKFSSAQTQKLTFKLSPELESTSGPVRVSRTSRRGRVP